MHVGKIDLKLIEADGGGKYLVHRPKRRAHKFGCNEAANLLSLTNIGTLWLNYICKNCSICLPYVFPCSAGNLNLEIVGVVKC